GQWHGPGDRRHGRHVHDDFARSGVGTAGDGLELAGDLAKPAAILRRPWRPAPRRQSRLHGRWLGPFPERQPRPAFPGTPGYPRWRRAALRQRVLTARAGFPQVHEGRTTRRSKPRYVEFDVDLTGNAGVDAAAVAARLVVGHYFGVLQ